MMLIGTHISKLNIVLLQMPPPLSHRASPASEGIHLTCMHLPGKVAQSACKATGLY